MRWLLFAILGPLSWAISTHIDKYLVDKYFHDSDTAVLIVFTAVVAMFALPVIWLFEPRVLSLPLSAIAVMTVSGILYMGAMLFYLRALQSEEASAVAPFFQLSTIFTLLLAGATFIVALSAVLFKYFAVEDSFWGTTFWTFVGEGVFGAGIILLPGYYRQFASLFKHSPGGVIGI